MAFRPSPHLSDIVRDIGPPHQSPPLHHYNLADITDIIATTKIAAIRPQHPPLFLLPLRWKLPVRTSSIMFRLMAIPHHGRVSLRIGEQSVVAKQDTAACDNFLTRHKFSHEHQMCCFGAEFAGNMADHGGAWMMVVPHWRNWRHGGHWRHSNAWMT